MEQTTRTISPKIVRGPKKEVPYSKACLWCRSFTVLAVIMTTTTFVSRLPTTAMFISLPLQHSAKSQNERTPNIEKDNDVDKNRERQNNDSSSQVVANPIIIVPPEEAYFTIAGNDRAGSVIHDMLIAHSWLWEQGKRYGGACIAKKLRHRTKILLNQLGLLDILPYGVQCPKNKSRIIERALYSKYDSQLMTESWKKHLLDEWNQSRPQNFAAVMQPREKDLDAVKIVVHARRGDVTPCKRPDRYLTNHYYHDLISHYKKINTTAGITVAVTILTEKDSFENMSVFEEMGYHLPQNMKLSELWKEMIAADILMISRSSFSFVPAIFSRGHVVYPPYQQHKPHESWNWHVVNATMIDMDKNRTRILREKLCQLA